MNNQCDCVSIKFIREANKINGRICDPFNITESMHTNFLLLIYVVNE